MLPVEMILSSTTFPHHGTRKSRRETKNMSDVFFIREEQKNINEIQMLEVNFLMSILPIISIDTSERLFYFSIHILEIFLNIVRLDHGDSHISFGNNHQVITRFYTNQSSYIFGYNYLRFWSDRNLTMDFNFKRSWTRHRIYEKVVKVGIVLLDYQFKQ
jgi:hypothetical protein